MKRFLPLIFFASFILYSCTPAAKRIVHEIQKRPSSEVYENYLKYRLSLNSHDLDAAIRHLEKAIDLDEDSITLHRDLASLYIRKNDKEKALTIVEAYYKKHPSSSEALMIIGRIKELLNHNKKDVTDVYEKVILLDRKKSTAYLFLGDIYFKSKKYKDALRIYKSYSGIFPSNFLGYYYMGKVEFQRGNYSAAKKHLKKSISLSGDIPSFFLLADTHRKTGNIKEAEIVYKKILIINPLNVKAVFDYSFVKNSFDNFYLEYLAKNLDKRRGLFDNVKKYLQSTKEIKKSIKALKFLSEKSSISSDLYYLTAVMYEKIKDSNSALIYYRKVKSNSNSYVKASISIASLLQDRKDYVKAASVLYKVHRLIPKNEEIILYLGILYSVMKDYKSAERILKTGIKLNSKNYAFHYRMGIVYDYQKRKKLMYKEMKKVIELRPSHANALNYLGYSYADSGINLDEAEKLIKRALTFKPDDGYITDSLGWVYYKKGRYKEAKKYLLLALKKVPKDPIILEHYGDVCLKLNDRKSAILYYEKALKYNKEGKKEILKLKKKIKALKGKPN